jgi:prepilin signal peptidase PulO-like enzyme (type II secretory pathway)
MSFLGLIFLWIAGWLAGSLINLLADQLPLYRKLMRPECAHCEHPLEWLVYLFLEPCPSCGAERSMRSTITQWFFPAAFILVGIWKPERLLTYEALIVIVYFGLVLIIDIEHRLILHPVSLFGAVLAAMIGVRLHGLLPTLYGGAAGFGMMLVLYFLGDLFARYMSHRRGESIDEVALGFGDVNFSGVLGLLLGWPGITLGLLLAILAGGIVSGGVLVIMLLRKRYQAFTALPYAPFLILAGVVLLLRP